MQSRCRHLTGSINKTEGHSARARKGGSIENWVFPKEAYADHYAVHDREHALSVRSSGLLCPNTPGFPAWRPSRSHAACDLVEFDQRQRLWLNQPPKRFLQRPPRGRAELEELRCRVRPALHAAS